MERVLLEGACRSLRLFPLPGAVLMPGAAMPLHVFEPRYRQLVKDCLAGDGILAIPQIRAGEEPAHLGRPGLYPYAGVGRIAAHQELPDGRYNIVVEPVGRVRILQELAADTPWRVVEAELLPERGAEVARLAEIGRRLRGLFGPLAARAGERGEAIERMMQQIPAERVAEAIAPWVLADSDVRQDYLAEDDAVRRAQRVESGVLQLLAETGLTGGGEA